MTGQNERFIAKRAKEPLIDRGNDRCEVATLTARGTRPPGKQGVSGEKYGCASHKKAHGTRGVAGGGDGGDLESTDSQGCVVIQREVIGGQHGGVLWSNCNLKPSLSEGRHGLNVVVVAMRFDDRAHPEAPCDVKEVVVFVGRVDKEGITRGSTTNHVDIVFPGPDNCFVHFTEGIFVNDINTDHVLKDPTRPCFGRGGPLRPSAAACSRKEGALLRRTEPHNRRRPHERDPLMNFAFNEEQDELRRMVNRFLQEKSPETEVRRLMATQEGYDPAVWSQMAEQLGLQSLIIPEEFGGSGFTYVELIVVLEEMGAALLCAPYFSTVVLGANAILHSGDEVAKNELLPGIASGETIATLAITEDSGRWELDAIEMKATKSGDGWVLNGAKNYVIDGFTASLILVAARTDAGLSLFAVEGDADGLIRESLSTMDQTRKQARLEFSNTPARLLGADGFAGAGLEKTLQLAAVALAAEQVGGAQRCLDTAVDYAKNRIQFGRPIGSFQAIKHKCADMLLEVESAKSAAYYAGWAAAEDNDELPVVSSLAKSYCSEAYFHTAAENIQIHGGIGFTWEHPAHLYFKRAKSSEILFGEPAYHRELLAQKLGI